MTDDKLTRSPATPTDTLGSMSPARNRVLITRLLRMAAFLCVAALLFALALQLDPAVYQYVNNRQGVPPEIYWMLYQIGQYTTWIAISPVVMVAHWLLTARKSALFSYERSLIVIWAPLLAGFFALAAKLLVRRVRPDSTGGEYVFRSFDVGAWDTTALGFPSGHAAVAFGGAVMLSLMFPRLAPIWLPVAALCALSRLLTQAHFLSDVTGGALVGVVSAWIVWFVYERWCDRRDPVLLRTWRLWQRRKQSPAGSAQSSPAAT